MPARLPRFLLLSLLAHAAVIAALHAPGFPATAGRTLDVTLLPASIASRSGTQRPKPAIAAHALHAATAVRKTALPKVSATESVTPVTPAGDALAPPERARPMTASQAAAHRSDPDGNRPQTSVQSGALGHQLVRAILHASAPYFHYPLLAREQGWEGRVTIRLRIGPHGRLSRMRVAGSSGYAVLDAAALRSLKHVTRLPDAAVPAGGIAFDVLVPVVYRLTES
ncbi:MAG: energy transducer TonB [Acidiferrobacterales bacterium]